MSVAAWIAVWAIAGGVPSVDRFGFSQGLRPLALDTPPSASLSAETCKECHRDVFEQWRSSRHAVAATNPIFLAGFGVEPKQRCRECHAPLERRGLAHEGVSCAVCHLRGGEILARGDRGQSEHAIRSEPELGSALCAGCHQFEFERMIGGKVELTGVLTQATFGEWSAWREAGGREDCAGCHLERGSHRFVGAHDLEFLRGSIVVRAGRIAAARHRFELESRGVGHHLPSGDLYRHFVLELREAGGEWRRALWIGRRFEVAEDDEGRAMKVLAEDTTLKPGAPRAIEIDGRAALQWRLRYFFTAEKNLERGDLPFEQAVVTVHEGESR